MNKSKINILLILLGVSQHPVTHCLMVLLENIYCILATTTNNFIIIAKLQFSPFSRSSQIQLKLVYVLCIITDSNFVYTLKSKLDLCLEVFTIFNKI